MAAASGARTRDGQAAARLLARLVIALLQAIALLPAGAAAAAPARQAGGVIQGTVTSVVDGDSLWITPDGGGKAIEVRLVGIDAPEICQAHGAESRAFLAQLVAKKPVRLYRTGHDGWGRTLGRVYLGDVELNRRLVEQGQAWSQRWRWDNGPYVSQERIARARSRGLHKAGSAAVMPRQFRMRHGPCRQP